jgi:hypothetical protein
MFAFLRPKSSSSTLHLISFGVQMFSDLRKFNDLRSITMLIEPAGDWVAGGPQLPTGDTSGNYADASTTYVFCSLDFAD